MLENADANSTPSRGDDRGNSSADYLRRAVQACAAGNAVLGMHLYLAAFEKASASSGAPEEDAIDGLKQAWALACRFRERSLAEYIFEKMEPYLTSDEVAGCAEQLQRMALDKLEEFGLTREDLEDMTDMISQDFLGMGAGLMKVEHLTEPSLAESLAAAQEAFEEAALSEGADEATGEGEPALALPDAAKRSEKEQGITGALAHAAEEAGVRVSSSIERITYADLAGYDDVVKVMRDFGVGMQQDEEFQDLVGLLNARHGLDRMPAADTLLFRSPAREDANRFMVATLGELGLPAIKMRMEENLQGMPVLCVMAQADNAPKLNASRNEFLGRGVLMLEDIDLWGSPLADLADDLGGFMFSQLSRGAREAINLIRSAVDNPDVYVLVSAAEAGEIDPFFFDLLEPLSIVDIDYPTPEERVDIWMEIAREHPSLRGVNRSDLVRYSASMPRYDMYMAAREAIEEAYKEGLVSRRYVPVTRENLFEKLAAYQPLDSEEYLALEEAVVKDFRADLEHIDDLLK